MVFRHRRRRMYHPPYSGVYTKRVVLRRCGEEREGVWPSKLCPRSVLLPPLPAMKRRERERQRRRRHRCWTTEEQVALLPLLLLLACDLQFPPSFPFFCPLERVATATIAAHHTTQWSRKFKGDKGAIERKNHCKNWCKKRFSHPVLGAVFLDGQILTSFPLFFFTRSRQLFWKSSSSLLDSPSLSFLPPSLFFLPLLPP